MWPLKQPILDIQCGWLALSHVKSLTTCCHLLPSIDWLLLIESCPAPPARAGGRAISWQVEKKTHGMNQWWTDPKWQNHGIYWWYSLWQSMTLFCTSSVKISYDLQVSWSLSQANYQIASSPGSKDSLKQTHGDLDSRTLMTCSHVESFSIRQKDAIGIYQTNQVLHKVTSLSVWHRSIRGASAQPTGKLCIAGLLKEVDWYYNPCFPEERHSQGLIWFKYSTV